MKNVQISLDVDFYEKQPFRLASHVGIATADDGTDYSMDMVNATTPSVTNMKTGNTVDVSWNNIIEIAIKAGIDVDLKVESKS